MVCGSAVGESPLEEKVDPNGHRMLTNLDGKSGVETIDAKTTEGRGTMSVMHIRSPKRTREHPYRPLIPKSALRHQLSPRLVEAVMAVESDFNPAAHSRAGAMGLMQLMPETANDLGVDDAWDPEQNIEGGALYLRMMLDRFDQNVDLALAAYNAGPGTVEKAGGIPRIPETRRYVRKVRRRLGHGTRVAGSGSLRTIPGRGGRVHLTNHTGTQSSLRILTDARGVVTLTNR